MVDGYDIAGRKVSQTVDAVTTLYTYDNASRLTGQQVTGARATFAYDEVGNQTVKHHEGSLPVTMAYDAASRQVTMQDGPSRVTFSYDDNGNTTVENRGGITTGYSYNRRNQLNVVTNSDGSKETMTYDRSIYVHLAGGLVCKVS
ncbi:MAG: RHS repeat protein [Fimbriimonadaceae bacterium]|nr:RHS repeat protein [Fimbriimonadaceae bacterium]